MCISPTARATAKLISAAAAANGELLLFLLHCFTNPRCLLWFNYVTMKRKVARLRLSPNEEAQLIREEHERRRKVRIQQVREQERRIALQIRSEVQRRRQQELHHLEENLREEWEQQHAEKLGALRRLYHESLQLLGQGHRSAKENEPDWAAISQREEDNQVKAAARYREALKDLKLQKQKDDEEQNRPIKARKRALQAEKERSHKVASLPPPPPNPIESIDPKKHVVKKSDVNAFAATRYHMPETTVDREVTTAQPDAHEEAEQEVRRLQELGREAEREREEQLEKARLRGKHALRREQLMQDRERFLVELEHMQQTDLLRRRQQLSHMPPQIFQPLYRRQDMREDCQREMEFAFEDMYTGERRVKGDLVLQLVPEPLPAPSTGSQDQELDVTLDDVVPPGAENSTHDTEPEAGSTEQETFPHAESSRPAPRRALKKLLDRIRSQRDQRCRVPADDLPTAVTDQIPERDSTIDTGSLTGEERDEPPPTVLQLPEPAQPSPALETTEESAEADTRRLPDVLADRIQEFEDERKKREEELQREKQQQIVLLQELEEQKVRLEQMLLEAQQERENLKAAVTQEAPVRGQEATSVTPGPASQPVTAAREEDHSRRIREYQQQLLEQNRLHKRSVEVARQRLEEYQRALRLRYNMTATSPPLPSVVPPGVIHPPLHRPEVAVPLAPPLQLPTGSPTPAYVPGAHAKPRAPVEVPTRESNTLAPPLPRSSRPGPVLDTRASLGVDSRSLPEQLQTSADRPSERRAGITAWLTDNIMDRVTAHLPATDPLSHRPFTAHHSTTSVPLRPSSDPIRAVSPNITGGPLPLPRQASVTPGTLLHGTSREDDMERQRREMQEVQRRVLEQREAMAQQQRQQEEERLRREEEREQMRRQKEALQALISADVQPEAASEVLLSEEIGRSRLRLLASLLKAIEESNGGTLSHLEDHQEQSSTASTSGLTDQSDDLSGPPPPPPHLRSGLHLLPRAPKPPVARVRLGVPEMMTEQHELSAIQEVETPANASLVTGPEDVVMSLPNAAARVPREEPEPSVASDRTLHTPSVSSGRQQSAGRGTGSGTGSETSSNTSWRERLLAEAGTSAGPPETDPIPSPPSSDSGRGADYPGPSFASYRSATESAYRPPDPDHLSSFTTISTGSYITTDPEQNSTHTDDSPPLARLAVERAGGGASLDVSSPSGQSSYTKDSSSPGSPHGAVDSLFHDSSIQRIIDKYTRELNISLNAAGDASASSADGDGSYLQEPSGSVSQQSGVRFLQRTEEEEEEERPADSRSLPSDWTGAQSHGLEWDNTVNRILERFSHRMSSFAQDQGRDSSFRPLIGQLADQSSCLPAEHRDSAVERLIGPLADQSSCLPAEHRDSAVERLIGPLADQSSCLPAEHRDSAVERLIGPLADQSSCLPAEHRDSAVERLIGPLADQSSCLPAEHRDSAVERLIGPLADQSSCLPAEHRDSAVERLIGPLADQSSCLPAEHRDSAVERLIGPLADQSSCLPAEHRDSAVERLIGQPSAHSSVIGQLPGQSVPVSADRGGWDSTVGRMIGRLSHQSSSHWLSGGHDFYASQLIGQIELERSSAWLDEGREESQMRPLVGELDESAGQTSGSSGETTSVALGGSTQVGVPSESVPPHSFPVPQDHQTPQTTASPPEHQPETSEVFPASDSFHPLLAELTHNETADPSMTFHLPGQEMPGSPEGSGQAPRGECSRSTRSEEEFEAHAHSPVDSDPSPERLRAEEPTGAAAALQESSFQLSTSQCHPHESVLLVSPAAAQEAELAALSLSNLTLCDAPPTPDLPPLPEGGDAELTSVSHRPAGSVTVGDQGAGEQNTNQRNAAPVWDLIREAASEKGILEESEITLVSLTDTTLQDQEATITEEEGEEEERRGEEAKEEREEHQKEEKEMESTLLPEKTLTSLNEEVTQSHAVMLLEFQGSGGEHLQEAFQQKHRALLQRSSHRVKEIKAKRAKAKAQPERQPPSEAKDPQPVSCKAKKRSEPQPKDNTRMKAAEDQTTETSSCSTAANSKQKKPQLPPPAGDTRLKKVDEVKISNPEQRKQEAAEMYQRTQRLYARLEEVKHQKEIRSRQEAYAKNRLKAQEFHRKTLQKLRTKQTPR